MIIPIELYINGDNMRTKYGAYELDGGLKAFFSPPKLKEPYQNEAEDINGVNIVAVNKNFQSREFTFPLYFKPTANGNSAMQNYNLFIEELVNTGINIFKVDMPSLSVAKSCIVLYRESIPTMYQNGGVKLEVKFLEPNPIPGLPNITITNNQITIDVDGNVQIVELKSNTLWDIN